MEERLGKNAVALCLKTYSVSKFHKQCNCKESKRENKYIVNEIIHSW